MNLSSNEKQLIWRGLCDSEELERNRITYHSNNGNKFNDKAREKMINTSKNRLKEIEKLKEKVWQSMKDGDL